MSLAVALLGVYVITMMGIIVCITVWGLQFWWLVARIAYILIVAAVGMLWRRWRRWRRLARQSRLQQASPKAGGSSTHPWQTER
jgi:uncharacterized membrane protein YcjF (UPF0283 family)